MEKKNVIPIGIGILLHLKKLNKSIFRILHFPEYETQNIQYPDRICWIHHWIVILFIENNPKQSTTNYQPNLQKSMGTNQSYWNNAVVQLDSLGNSWNHNGIIGLTGFKNPSMSNSIQISLILRNMWTVDKLHQNVDNPNVIHIFAIFTNQMLNDAIKRRVSWWWNNWNGKSWIFNRTRKRKRKANIQHVLDWNRVTNILKIQNKRSQTKSKSSQTKLSQKRNTSPIKRNQIEVDILNSDTFNFMIEAIFKLHEYWIRNAYIEHEWMSESRWWMNCKWKPNRVKTIKIEEMKTDKRRCRLMVGYTAADGMILVRIRVTLIFVDD